ncbi:MAG: DUF2339 domain-containing protein [Ahniella sp.]|nr:DUF2339 domain-containing protein [Ahniella sp.]
MIGVCRLKYPSLRPFRPYAHKRRPCRSTRSPCHSVLRPVSFEPAATELEPPHPRCRSLPARRPLITASGSPPPRPTPRPAQSAPPRASAPKAPSLDSLRWLIEGNWVAKVGIVLVLIALGAFFKFASKRGWLTFPIELRLAGVAAAAIVALALGWRERVRRRIFALNLQGGAIAVLLLTVFAAYRIYHLFDLRIAAAAGYRLFDPGDQAGLARPGGIRFDRWLRGTDPGVDRAGQSCCAVLLLPAVECRHPGDQLGQGLARAERARIPVHIRGGHRLGCAALSVRPVRDDRTVPDCLLPVLPRHSTVAGLARHRPRSARPCGWFTRLRDTLGGVCAADSDAAFRSESTGLVGIGGRDHLRRTGVVCLASRPVGALAQSLCGIESGVRHVGDPAGVQCADHGRVLGHRRRRVDLAGHRTGPAATSLGRAVLAVAVGRGDPRRRRCAG